MNKLLDAWLSAQKVDVETDEYDEVSWAVDELFELSYEDPEKLFTIIPKILEKDSSVGVVGALGAGVIEEALVNHGELVIDIISELSQKNSDFARCLRFTFVDKKDVSKDVYQKFQSLKLNTNV